MRCTLCGKEVEGDLAEHLTTSHQGDLRGRQANSKAVYAWVVLTGLVVSGLILFINERFCSDVIARC